MPGGVENPTDQLGKGHSLPEETEEDCPQALRRRNENPRPHKEALDEPH